LNEPITMASTYVAGGDVEYGRYGNPTWTAFEDALGALEGGRCLAFASGLAAVGTVLDLVGADQTVVAPRHAYNGTVMQLADLESRGRARARLVDMTDTAAVVAACDDFESVIGERNVPRWLDEDPIEVDERLEELATQALRRALKSDDNELWELWADGDGGERFATKVTHLLDALGD
jgi:hypothetical protein